MIIEFKTSNKNQHYNCGMIHKKSKVTLSYIFCTQYKFNVIIEYDVVYFIII